MKKKLFVVLLSCGLLIAPTAQAKEDNQRVPRWVIEMYESGHRCPKIENDLRALNLPVKAFSYLAWRESRCRAQVIGWNYHRGFSRANCQRTNNVDAYKRCSAVDSYDSGLLQVNSSWVTVTANVCKSKWGDMSVLRRKKCNLRVAKHLFNNGGFIHWRIS